MLAECSEADVSVQVMSPFESLMRDLTRLDRPGEGKSRQMTANLRYSSHLCSCTSHVSASCIFITLFMSRVLSSSITFVIFTFFLPLLVSVIIYQTPKLACILITFRAV